MRTRLNLLTVASVSACAMVSADLVHEGVGHALVSWLVRDPILSISTVALQNASNSRAVSAAGTSANLLVGVLSLLLFRRSRVLPAPALFLWLFGAFNLFNSGYLIESAITDSGDWANVVSGLAPPLFWRIMLALSGAALYFAAVHWLRESIAPVERNIRRALQLLLGGSRACERFPVHRSARARYSFLQIALERECLEPMKRFVIRNLLLFSLLPFAPLCAQAPSAPAAKAPDTLLFTNGEKLVGHLERTTGDSVIFKSEMAGIVTVKWSKVKELHAAGPYAVIPKNVELSRKTNAADVAQGAVALSDGKLQVTPPPGAEQKTFAVADVPYVVTEPDFRKVTEDHPGFLSGWKGGVTGGASLVEATQTSQAFTGSLALARVEPFVDWFTPMNRTTVNFSAAYGKVTEPGNPTIKTEIYHADGERDEYFSKRFYAFGQIAFDHNFSQGLDLEQLYGGGIGITFFKRANQELDGKASADYIRQAFTESASNKSLIGSQFGDAYFYKFPKGILFTQGLTVTPAWNNTNAWTALGAASLLFPAYKRLSFNLSAQDNYLNDPPAGFKKNSFQSSAGLTYTIR